MKRLKAALQQIATYIHQKTGWKGEDLHRGLVFHCGIRQAADLAPTNVHDSALSPGMDDALLEYLIGEETFEELSEIRSDPWLQQELAALSGIFEEDSAEPQYIRVLAILEVLEAHVVSIRNGKASLRRRRKNQGVYRTPRAIAEYMAQRMLESLSALPNRRPRILDPAVGCGALLLATADMLEYTGRFEWQLSDLYGVDVDQLQMEICRVLMKLNHGSESGGTESPILLPGDSLVGTLRGKPSDMDRTAAWESVDWDNDLPEVFGENDGFDAVICNPPYLLVDDQHYKDYLRENYSSFEGEIDLYTFFIERGLKLCRPGGVLCMIVSNTFLTNHHCTKIRRLLTEQSTILELTELPYGAFRFAPAVQPVILLARNEPPPPGHRLVIRQLSETDKRTLNSGGTRESALQADWSKSSNGFLFNTAHGDEKERILRVMEKNSVPLERIARITVGIQLALNRGETRPHLHDKRLGPTCKKCIGGRDISPYKVEWNGKWVDYGPWLTYAGREENYLKPKLLYQNIRNQSLDRRLVAALDKNGLYPLNTLSLIVDPVAPYDLKFLEQLLNSELINFWFKSRFAGFHITVTQVSQIPVPLLKGFNPDKLHPARRCGRELTDEPSLSEIGQVTDEALANAFGLVWGTVRELLPVDK